MSDDRPFYDVDPSWSPERCEAFALYRDMGAERNLRGVAQVLRKSATLMNRWSSEDQWVRRAAAWDSYQDKLRQAEVTEERRRIAKRHAAAVDTTIEVLMQPAQELARRIENGEVDLTEIPAPSLIEWSTIIGRVYPRLVVASRLVHGMSTENVEEVKSEHRTKIEGATQEELDAMLVLDDGADQVVERLQLPAPAEDS